MPPTPVLYVIDSLDVAGTERQLAYTLTHLDRDTFPPAVLALFRRGPIADTIEALGIPVTIAGARAGAYRENATIVERAAREHDASIVHAMLYESHVAGHLAARRTGALGISHLVNEYDSPWRDTVDTRPPAWKASIARMIERRVPKRGRARYIAVADVVADSAATNFHIPRASIPVVRRGFVFDELDARAAEGVVEQAWTTSAGPRLLAVGRLTEQKGHRSLIKAMPDVVRSAPDVQLVIAGEGPLRTELDALARSLGVEDNVRLLGVRDDVPALIGESDVFVFPSLWEGAAGALVEALGSAAVVVASDIPAHRELVADEGSLVRPADPGSIAAGLIAALDSLEERRATAMAHATTVRAAHDIVANTQLMESTYRAFLEEDARRR